MDKKPFSNIQHEAGGTEQTARWYQKTVRAFASAINSPNEVFGSDLGEFATQLDVGSMYMYTYNPKTKQTLPYWDTCPLVMITEPLPNGFSGLNLHYLSPLLRATLLDKVIPTGEITSKSKLGTQWHQLSNFSKFPEARRSTKRYLSNQITSRMFKVDPKHWKSAIFLPVQRFQGASDALVYRETMENN